jgi:hypothetical protein
MTMPRTLTRALAALAVGASTSGCAALYIPGDVSQRTTSTDPVQLRKVVRIVPVECDRRGAAGTVSNPSESALAVTVAVTWTGSGGDEKRAVGRVRVPAGASARWKVSAPVGASDAAGCSTAVRDVSLLRG